MTKSKIFFTTLIFLMPIYGMSQTDSTDFFNVKSELHGCWKIKKYQFKFDSTKNFGQEYKSRIHSSAPIFKLVIKNKKVYINWMELTGGGSFHRIVWIRRKKMKVENEDGSFTIYRKTNC